MRAFEEREQVPNPDIQGTGAGVLPPWSRSVFIFKVRMSNSCWWVWASEVAWMVGLMGGEE